jgi:broad specificity phosphatase PhoE
MMKRVATALVLLLFCLAVACNRPQQGSTVILVVRHAEKASDAEDSPLTDAGVQRAQALAGVAADAGVSAIYITQFKRNRDTAQPLAQRLGVAPMEVPVNLQSPGDYGQRLAREIVEKHRGQTVLVIGHGNTIASVVEGLTGRNPQLGDVQYSDLLVVTVPPSGTASLIRARYGAGAAGNSMMK